MAVDQNLVLELRENTGETIPEGGTAADTLFTEEQVERWITTTSSIEGAILKAWLVKQAYYSNLANVTDGAASRTFTDLFNHATQMVKQYTELAIGPTAGRTRVGKIVRSS